MKKKLTILMILGLVLLTGGTYKNFEYYKNISNIVVNLFTSEKYDSKDIDEKDKKKIDEYLNTLTHKNHEIDLTDFIIKNDEYKVNEPNSKEVYIKNNKCYVNYNDLGFDYIKEENDPSYELELQKYLVCNNYYTILYESDFYMNYEENKDNPKYDYVYKQSVKFDKGYYFLYNSSYDGTGLVVKMYLGGKDIEKIETSFENINNYITSE